MKIQVNNKLLECADNATLLDVAALLQLPDKGVAVAVNNRMIPRTVWNDTLLNEGDSLVVIKAACGG